MSLHAMHRERLDKKVSEYGLESLEPHEQLEYLLFAVIPRGDTNELAHNILNRFQTISGAINASMDELMSIEGVGRSTARFLTSLPALLGIVERSILVDKPLKLNGYERLANFVKTFFYGKLTESAYMLSMNSSFRLLSITRISEGVQGETAVYVPKVVRQALNDRASTVVIVHNHPCGLVNPSVADIELSEKLQKCFNMVDIEFFDSLIVSGNDVYSITLKENIGKNGKVEPKRRSKDGV
ncbi:MAG: RadC family protein [Clostridia bacterium]|nr:RadC family protein [Clostridia bacterium]